MKWLSNRFLLFSYFVLLAALAVAGCTSKEDPSEVLPLCGNHTCGELTMLTTDMSTDGFHYLNATLSPDQSRVLFTADWTALPADVHYDDDAFYTNYRQIIVMPLPEYLVFPAPSLESQGALLVRLNGFLTSVWIAGNSTNLGEAENDRKGGPVWLDDQNIIFWMHTPRGNRLFTADITNICPEPTCNSPARVLYMEPSDASVSGGQWQHMDPTLSPDGQWLAFTRSGCAIPDSFETCSGLSLQVMRMSTAGQNNGYNAEVYTLTSEVSRIEEPRWSPFGNKIIFSAGLDLDGGSTGLGTELFTIDVDTTALNEGEVVLNNNLDRLTHTSYSDGDPIVGVFNTSPCYTPDMSEVYFVSTRRAPTTTLHDRNLWKIPANGSLDPEILYFTRADDLELEVLPNGMVLLSSLLGYPTEILDQIEEYAYQYIVENNPDGLTEIDMRAYAANVRTYFAFFEGVMAHLYIFQP